MFFNNCSGCLQVPVPMQYWSPYIVPVKKSSFHTADIMTNSNPQMCQDVSRKSTGVKYADFSRTHRRSGIKRIRDSGCMTRSVKHFRRSLTSETDIVKTTKDRNNVRCSLPSPLASLQAMCLDGVAPYNDRSGDTEKQHSDRKNSNSSLKFGMDRILSEDFGKEKTEKGPYSVLNTEVNGGGHSKRKRSWSRTVFSNLQQKGLEKCFEVARYVTKHERRLLAAMLGLTDTQVRVWFVNRRVRWRNTSQQQQQTDEEKDTSNDSRDDDMDTGDTVTDMEKRNLKKTNLEIACNKS